MGEFRRAAFLFVCSIAGLACSASSKPHALDDDADGGVTSPGVDAATPPSGLSPSDEAALDAFMTAHMTTAHVPGAAVAVLAHGDVVWTKGYGQASIADGVAATPDTLFELASISKTFVGVAIMQLVEQGKIALDDDVDAHLPFTARNPNFPNAPITYRMLLTHTSSLLDGDAMSNLVVTPGADAPTLLADWIKGYVVPGGASYAADNWSTSAPGTTYSYSNAAVTLAGYLVEVISGQSLQDYCQANIFAPLAMQESSWFLKGLDTTHIAHPYEWKNGAFVDKGFYGFPDYPDGQLRTSASQLARFLAMFVGYGTYQGTQVLKSATVTEMRRPQVASLGGDAANQGLIWYYASEIDGTQTLGHSGAYIGISTDMYFDPKTGNGYVLLTNGGVYYDHLKGPDVDAMSQMDARLLETAQLF